MTCMICNESNKEVLVCGPSCMICNGPKYGSFTVWDKEILVCGLCAHALFDHSTVFYQSREWEKGDRFP